jgi:hypothetical protein
MHRPLAALLAAAVFCLASLLAVTRADAHAQSYGFLRVEVLSDHDVKGQLELAVRDLDLYFDIDADGDGKVTWGELRPRENEISFLVVENLSMGPIEDLCRLNPEPIMIDQRGGENYVIIPFSGPCGALGKGITVAYDIMFGVDAQHRGLAEVKRGEVSRSAVFTPDKTWEDFDFEADNNLKVFNAFVGHGMHHIWTGYDHMLFLITLLLSAVVTWSKKERRWLPVKTLPDALWPTTYIVTAFTIAHSITLSAAVFGLVELSPVFVECAIAASVAAAAINNLFPVVSSRVWIAAFVFGLMHGFGFANVLTELGLPPDRKLLALLAFNVGVELGQLAVVAVVLPILFWVRNSTAYRRVGLPVGSLAILVIAVIWFVQRATGTELIFG